jgi:hypothetical protein
MDQASWQPLLEKSRHLLIKPRICSEMIDSLCKLPIHFHCMSIQRLATPNLTKSLTAVWHDLIMANVTSSTLQSKVVFIQSLSRYLFHWNSKRHDRLQHQSQGWNIQDHTEQETLHFLMIPFVTLRRLRCRNNRTVSSMQMHCVVQNTGWRHPFTVNWYSKSYWECACMGGEYRSSGGVLPHSGSGSAS